MARMTTFDEFPSVPRTVDEQTRLFLLAVRKGMMEMHTSISGDGQQGDQGSQGPEGEKGQAGADGDDADAFLLMGA